MSTRWIKGQNALLLWRQIRVTLVAEIRTDVSLLLLTPSGTVRSDADFIFYNQPHGPGVVCGTTGGDRPFVDINLDIVPEDISRLIVAISPDDQTMTFASCPAPIVSVETMDGQPRGDFVMSGLTQESAVIALEFYRRGDQWKIRAVGQGYEEGLAHLVGIYGVETESEDMPTPEPSRNAPIDSLATSISVSADRSPAQAIRFAATGIDQSPKSHERERLYDQIWSIFEDAARSSAAFVSASDFAQRRLERELSDIVADPATRHSVAATRARAQAQERHDQLIARATADHVRDGAQLRSELDDLGRILPAPMAAWGSSSWTSWVPPQHPSVAIRVGELYRDDRSDLAIPFVLRLPVIRPLWVDTSGGREAEASVLTRCLITRFLAAYPPGDLVVHIVDLAGRAAVAKTLGSILSPGSSVLAPIVNSPSQLSAMLTQMVGQVDMIRMATSAGADDLLLTAGVRHQLIVLHDFPYGLDDRGMASIRFIIEEGMSAYTSFIFVADPADSSDSGSAAEMIWQASTRLATVPSEYIGDPWVGLPWTYSPDSSGVGQAVDAVLKSLSHSLPKTGY